MAVPNVTLDIRTYLVDTVGLTNVTIGAMAPMPINQYAVVEFPGRPNIKTHGRAANPGGVVLDEANIQIQCRNTSAQTALTNILAIVTALDGLGSVTINGVVYTYFNEMNRPRIISRQEEGSTVYAWDCHVQALR